MLLAWEISARIFFPGSRSWPPVSDVVVTLAWRMVDGQILTALGESILRMSSGFVLGSLAGVACGLAMGLFAPLRWTIGTVVEALRPIPAAAIIPPLIFILGIDNALKISIISLAVFFPVVINTLSGTLSIDPTLLDVARTFRISRTSTLLRVALPAVLPYVFTGMRTGISIALITTVVAEMIAGSGGIGYYILNMQYAMRPSEMYAGILVLAALGYATNALFRAWEMRVLHWAHL